MADASPDHSLLLDRHSFPHIDHRQELRHCDCDKVKLIVNQRHLCQLSGQDYLDCIPDLGDQAVRED